MRKVAKQAFDELRPEYSLAELGKGVRGKYFKAASRGSNVVVLEPDVARLFPDSKAVNEALRLLGKAATKASRARNSAARVGAA